MPPLLGPEHPVVGASSQLHDAFHSRHVLEIFLDAEHFFDSPLNSVRPFSYWFVTTIADSRVIRIQTFFCLIFYINNICARF